MTRHTSRQRKARFRAALATLVVLGAAAAVAENSIPFSGPDTASAATVALTGYPTLQTGSSGTPVKILQRLLVGYGKSLTVDGSFGPITASAAKSFQSGHGLSADGIVGPNTWGALVPTLATGQSGPLVKALQATLNDGGASLTVDGSFGPATAAAVKQVQAHAGLTQDDVAGPNTWRALVNGSSAAGGNSGKDYSDPQKKYANGRLPDSALCTISYSTTHRLACYDIGAWEAFNSAFRAARGKNIPITQPTYAAYRTYAEQQYLYAHCPSATLGCGRAAAPGTSNHGFGKAIDINWGSLGSADRSWLVSHDQSYGFTQDEKGEPWHFHYTR